MARSDFNVVKVNHHFTYNGELKEISFPIEGNQQPVDDAYLLIQVQGVANHAHKLSINHHLVHYSIYNAPGNSQAHRVGLGIIEPGVLVAGTNWLRIKRGIGSNDQFWVGSVIVNWREP